MSDELDRQTRLAALRQKALDDIQSESVEDVVPEVTERIAAERSAIRIKIVELHRAGHLPEYIARSIYEQFESTRRYEFAEVVERVRAEIRQIDLSKPKSRWDRFREWFAEWWAEACL